MRCCVCAPRSSAPDAECVLRKPQITREENKAKVRKTRSYNRLFEGRGLKRGSTRKAHKGLGVSPCNAEPRVTKTTSTGHAHNKTCSKSNVEPNRDGGRDTDKLSSRFAQSPSKSLREKVCTKPPQNHRDDLLPFTPPPMGKNTRRKLSLIEKGTVIALFRFFAKSPLLFSS